MKTVLLPFCLLLAALSFGQTEEFGRWKIGSSISYDKQIDLENSGDVNPEPYTEPYKCGYGMREINFSTGIVGQYALTRKLEIGTGITYSKKTVMTTSYGYGCFGNHYGGYGLSSTVYATPVRLNYLEVPVFARYNFLTTKLNFHVESGVTTGMILNDFSYNQSKFSMSAQVGLGMSYTISNLINISATAFYERKVLNFDRSISISTPNSASFELRAAYIF